MKCPICDIEMILYESGEQDEYVCRNPQCPNYDQRLERPQEQE